MMQASPTWAHRRDGRRGYCSFKLSEVKNENIYRPICVASRLVSRQFIASPDRPPAGDLDPDCPAKKGRFQTRQPRTRCRNHPHIGKGCHLSRGQPIRQTRNTRSTERYFQVRPEFVARAHQSCESLSRYPRCQCFSLCHQKIKGEQPADAQDEPQHGIDHCICGKSSNPPVKLEKTLPLPKRDGKARTVSAPG